MTTLDLVEHAAPLDVALPDDIGVALAESGVATVAPTRRSGWWRVSAVRKVGVVVLNGVEVRIAPKIPVSRLLFLLGYARDPSFWRDPPVMFAEVDDLVAAVAYGFVRQAERALRHGVLHGYVEREESLTVLRGRLRTADQLTRRHGMPLPLEVRYDDFVDDIAENRLLRTAAHLLAGLPRVPASVAGRLRRLSARLNGARLIARREPRPKWATSRLNARYVPALRLAELVLDAASIEQGLGAVASSGFLIDTWRAFEDFVGIALGEALAPHGGSLDLQSTRDHLDIANRVQLRPDMVWRRDGSVVAVLDAKYKVETERGVPEADLYQMLAYCTALGLPRGHLLYARGLGPVREHEVQRAGTVLSCRALDLDQEPEALLADVGYVAMELAEEAAEDA